VNFDIQGSDLLPSLSTTSFAVGPETGTGLTELALAAIQGEAFGTLPISYIFGQLRSDYANFVDGSVPTVFFSDSTNGCYHTINDDVDVVDWTKLGKQARIGLRVTKLLADTDTPPTFVAPNPSLAEYRDAVTLAQVFEAGLVDQALFSPADQQVLLDTRDAIAQIAADGPDEFDNGDVGVLLNAALQGIAAIQRIGCLKP